MAETTTQTRTYTHTPRSEEEKIFANDSSDPGTFCPRCKMIYIGRETILGRPIQYDKYLVPVVRCDNCNFLAAWKSNPLT